MLKWIIILIVFYLAYRIIIRSGLLRTPPGKKAPAEIQDEMVQDPVCKTYVPRRMALEGNRSDGQRVFFCSPECREKYLKKKPADAEK
jgi:YHS domain-containing protein